MGDIALRYILNYVMCEVTYMNKISTRPFPSITNNCQTTPKNGDWLQLFKRVINLGNQGGRQQQSIKIQEEEINMMLEAMYDKEIKDWLKKFAAVAKTQDKKMVDAILQAQNMLSVQKCVDENFKLSDIIGSGSSADVYRGYNTKLNQDCVVKKIKKPDPSRSGECAQRFAEVIKEVAILILLADESYVVNLQDSFQDMYNYYICMEYCEGGELFDKIFRMGHFSEVQSLKIIKQLLEFCEVCHSQKIVHRDLKPENILLLKQPKVVVLESGNLEMEDVVVKVADFGASTFCVEGQMLSKKFGTPYYVAPEVLQQNYNCQIDVWSAGVILYIMLTGSPPFDGQGDPEIIQSVLRGKVTFSQKQWANISPLTVDLIRKMLAPASQRWTPTQLLQHDAFSAVLNRQSQLGKHVICQVKYFQPNSRLKQLFIDKLVQAIDNQELQELYAKIQAIDVDGSGIISADEMYQILTSAGIKLKVQAWDRIFVLCQVDSNNNLQYLDFISAMLNTKKILQQRKTARKSFELLDEDGDGIISARDLALTSGYRISVEEATFLMQDYLFLHGGIDYDSFQRLIVS
eukprot:TRINITY_DN14954_c0_g1_i4.p1 TRINITY_DN14954_c0_g1~~TRINITY_DN14954_c0_g1_i4.p1  ORF type:complete len:575 (-),score=51.32 TRINITY_DN14954_c0_g1_i4:1356-3080(-)